MTPLALGRPWTSDRAVRRLAGPWQWWTFPAGAEVRCPVCAGVLAEYGTGLAVSVRVHPIQRAPRPTEPLGEARRCHGCRHFVDLAFAVLARNGNHA